MKRLEKMANYSFWLTALFGMIGAMGGYIMAEATKTGDDFLLGIAFAFTLMAIVFSAVGLISFTLCQIILAIAKRS